MNFINYLILLFFKRYLKKVEFFKKYPAEVQARNFFWLIKKAQSSDWGKKYNYKEILKAKDFSRAYEIWQEKVPLSYYDDIKPWITRVRQGEKNVLWPGEVHQFSKSSGTTSDKSKFLPVTKTYLKNCHYATGEAAFAMYFKQNPKSKLFAGRILSLGGSKRQDELVPKNSCGDVSAILMANLPKWIQILRVPKIKIALMEEWESKLEEIVKDTKNKNVIGLAGVPSWMLVLLRKMELETGKKIKDIWPNLEMFVYGGVALGPYKQQYKNICGENFKFLETYGSAEGFFGVNDDSARNDMLLMLDYEIFYEFVLLEELKKEKPRAVSISEVELNKNYAIVISGSCGLWRYIIGDTIKFTELKPYHFIISGRIQSFINVFGEELMVDNANRAITLACEKTGALVQEYSAAPIFMEELTKGRHEWLIEFVKEPENLDEFAQILDEALQSLNSDYEAKRYKDITLGQLKLVVARKNLFSDWLASKNKLGGQNKIPRLSNNRELFEEMLALNN